MNEPFSSLDPRAAGAAGYPYVIVRWAACVYQRVEVRIEEGSVAVMAGDAISLPVGERGRRGALVEFLRAAVAATGRRMCAVFGERDAVYVEIDGSVNESDRPPSGGVVLDQMEVVNQERSPTES